MKHLAQIITLALCFCIAPTTFAQDGEHYQTYGSRVMEAQAWALVSGDPYYVYSDSLGQSLYHPGGNLHSLRLTIADFFSLDTVPATITLYEDHVYGPIVTVKDTVVPGMNKYISAEVLQTVSQSGMSTLINQIFNEAADGTRSFEEMSTEYVIDMVLPPGNYAFIVRVDGTVTHSYPGGGSHRSHIGCPTNQLVADPYQDGFALWGGCIGQGGDSLREFVQLDFTNWDPEGLTIDMAFEFTVSDMSTSVASTNSSEEDIFVQDGRIMFPSSWFGERYDVHDVAGRLLASGLASSSGYKPDNTQVILVSVSDKLRGKKVMVVE